MEQHQTEQLESECESMQEPDMVDAAADEPEAVQKERYFGSVRFFKNMILLAVIIMIAIPTGLSVYTLQELHKTEA